VRALPYQLGPWPGLRPPRHVGLMSAELRM